MYVRRLDSKKDRGERYEMLHHAALKLSANAHWLLHFLLQYGESIEGPLADLYKDPRVKRGAGLTKNQVEQAGKELAAAGFYSYGQQRGARGRLSRVRGVTGLPGALPAPVLGFPPVSPTSQPPTSDYAESHPADNSVTGVTSADTPTDDASAQVGPVTDHVQGRVRPAETPDVAGGTRSYAYPVTGVTSADTPTDDASAQVGPVTDHVQGRARPAGMSPDFSILPGQGMSPSRAHAREDLHTEDPSPLIPQLPEARHEPGRGEGELEMRYQRMAYDVVFRLPRQLQMSDQERGEVLPDIAAKLAEGHLVAAVLAELSHDLPPSIMTRKGFIRGRLAAMPPWRLPVDTSIHAATVTDRGIYAAGQRPGVADEDTRRELMRQAREALQRPRGPEGR